jgi:hypothetical protein
MELADEIREEALLPPTIAVLGFVLQPQPHPQHRLWPLAAALMATSSSSVFHHQTLDSPFPAFS